MTRFDYLAGPDKPRKKDRKSAKKAGRARDDGGADPVEAVQVRRDTVRAVARELRHAQVGTVDDLVETLLLAWLRDRAR
ncbi:hypothetical protein HNQ07_000707 [Deinococcus metalli]|uniref:Uncharacterized protein n=1 Tax=Deinococcus metalli TaxID=1141878 RepID=A0A7W8KDW7_9DEIO|nr:hypothetical protein [Deinococcus metalli]MBB5375263.1 hypothetical protein [Deinococcus metalli]GHF30552.1 hypothetical protein GCM10017781_03340 [Deinococcus metalli]